MADDARDDDLLDPKLDAPIAFIVAAVYLAFALFTEKFQHCNGYGDDGCMYGTWAQDFPHVAIDNKLGSYGIQRAFPSLVAWASLKLTHQALDPPHVIRAFECMNAACMFIGCFVWTKIARILAIGRTSTLLGTLACFGAYGVMKFTAWYPVLGDLWGFAIGFVVLWGYLAKRLWAIALATVVAAFTWPSAAAPGLLLMFFFGVRPAEVKPAPFRLNVVVSAVVAIGWVLFVAHLLNIHYWPPALIPVETMPQAVKLSALCAAAFFFFGLRGLTNYGPLWDPRTYLRALATPGALLAIATVVAIRYVVSHHSVPESAGFEKWLDHTAFTSVTKPAIFVVAHPVYLGPLVLLLLLRWKDVVAHVHALGPGPVSVFVLSLLFWMDCESRHSLHLFSFMLPFGIKVLDERRLDRRTLGVLAILTVVGTKLWLTMPATVGRPSWDFPHQTAFMSQGPWMANFMYFVQGVIVVLIAIWLHRKLAAAERAGDGVIPREHAGR